MSLLLSDRIFSQESTDLTSTWNYFKTNRVVLNSLEPPEGYIVSYNCDSMLFVRGDFSDTIKIWTPGVEWAYTLRQFGELTVRPEYGKTVFAKSIFSDGRILVASYMETVFVFRNDSLYEIEDTVSMPSEYFSLTVDHVLGKIDDTIFKQKKDSIELLHKDRHAFISK